MKKFLACLTLGLLVGVLVLGCSYNGTKPIPNNLPNNSPNNGVVNPNPEQTQVEVTLYFANKEYVETGNENLEKLLPEKRMISVGKVTKEEAIVRELLKGTTNSNAISEIPPKIELRSVQVVEEIAYVDFSSNNLSGGSLQESLMIGQIVNTLTELNNVKKVQFLVDGKTAETLMGHIDVRNPLTKAN